MQDYYSTLATFQMKKMFKDIFFGQTLNAETVLEMHYIQRTGSVETDELGKFQNEAHHSTLRYQISVTSRLFF